MLEVVVVEVVVVVVVVVVVEVVVVGPLDVAHPLEQRCDLLTGELELVVGRHLVFEQGSQAVVELSLLLHGQHEVVQVVLIGGGLQQLEHVVGDLFGIGAPDGL